MKKLLVIFAMLFNNLVNAQTSIVWQNTIGGSLGDEIHSLQQTADKGYILAGWSDSNSSLDKNENSLGGIDYWVVKLDSSCNIEWENTIGGNGSDYLHSIQQTTDRGYILGGYSTSGISGDKTESCLGSFDYWVVKLNAVGNIQWQNTIGGSNIDQLFSIKQTSDGGYILGGLSASNISADKTENCIGGNDYWVVKLNAIGDIQWQNTIGGNNNDNLRSLQQTADRGYILGGYSLSGISADKTENCIGSNDYWVVKLDSSGQVIQWQNTIGGTNQDYLNSLQQTTDRGYILGGYSSSNISPDKTENCKGSDDYWVVKLDPSGQIIQWQNTIGGSAPDDLNALQQTADGGYILGGYSQSNISPDKSENSYSSTYDFWVVKLNSIGVIERQNTIGGTNNDYVFSITQSADGDYVVGGYSVSNISSDKTENSINNTKDYWIIKLTDLPLPVELLSFNAEADYDIVNISWQTASETNNDYFTVEKSTDGYNFISATIITGAGNSNSVLNYSVKDYYPYDGISYYRLKQTDFDGQYSYSETVSVNFENKTNTSILIFPSPTTEDNIYLSFKYNTNDTVFLNIYDISGAYVSQKTLYTVIGENSTVLNTSGFAKGKYIIQIMGFNRIITSDFIKY